VSLVLWVGGNEYVVGDIRHGLCGEVWRAGYRKPICFARGGTCRNVPRAATPKGDSSGVVKYRVVATVSGVSVREISCSAPPNRCSVK
jgi:hypothetical protein